MNDDLIASMFWSPDSGRIKQEGGLEVLEQYRAGELKVRQSTFGFDDRIYHPLTALLQAASARGWDSHITLELDENDHRTSSLVVRIDLPQFKLEGFPFHGWAIRFVFFYDAHDGAWERLPDGSIIDYLGEGPQHPHGNSPLCTGWNYEWQELWRRAQWDQLLSSALVALTTVTAGNTIHLLMGYPHCANCEQWVGNAPTEDGDYHICAHCGDFFCNDCALKCEECGDAYCLNCGDWAHGCAHLVDDDWEVDDG